MTNATKINTGIKTSHGQVVRVDLCFTNSHGEKMYALKKVLTGEVIATSIDDARMLYAIARQKGLKLA